MCYRGEVDRTQECVRIVTVSGCFTGNVDGTERSKSVPAGSALVEEVLAMEDGM